MDETAPIIELSFFDYASGIALDSLRIELDGIDLLPSCTVEPSRATCPTTALAEGAHTVRASVFDLAGNSVRSTLSFEIVFDTDPPVIEILSPAPQQILPNRYVEVHGTVSDDGLVDGVVVNGQRAVVADGLYEVSLQLTEGLNVLEATATDSVGKTSTVSIQVTADTLPPLAVVSAPEAGATTNLSLVSLEGEVSDATSVVDLQANGISVAVVNGSFSAQISLTDGLNEISLEATDEAGNIGSFIHPLTLFALPSVEIDAPANPTRTQLDRVTVQGTVTGPVIDVTVSGLPAQVSDGQFLAPDVPLSEGTNVLAVVATAPSGAAGVAAVTVVRDSNGPRIVIEFPRDGLVTTSSAVPLRGLALEGGESGAADVPMEVTVNGIPANVSGSTFFLPSVPLAIGQNEISIEASDDLGNLSQKTVLVQREPPSGAGQLAIASGNLQTAVAGTSLPQPLEVLALDAGGAPVAAVPVVFSVRGNNGSLGNGERRQVVITGADGMAAVDFVLGTFAGVGSQVVRAEAVGFGAGVDFFATSVPGEPLRVLADSGSSQYGTIGQELASPLVVAVTDQWANRLADVPVTFP